MYVELVNGPNDGQWIDVPDELPTTILMPLGQNWAGIQIKEYEFSKLLNAEYRKEYGNWISNFGEQQGVRYEYVGIN